MGRGFFVVSRRKKQFTVSFTAIFKKDNFIFSTRIILMENPGE